VLEDGQAGVLVPVEDTNALQEAMERMIAEEGTAAHFAHQASARVENNYSIQSVAARYIRLYHTLVHGARGETR
jgi:glycosyltransferase involved in cell wall biosynthesis